MHDFSVAEDMSDLVDIHRPVLMFDVLGTLVDQAGSLRREVGAVTGWDDTAAGSVVTAWLTHVAHREREINAGDSAFVPSHALDAQALEQLSAEIGLPSSAIPQLTSAACRLTPWPGAVEGIRRLAADFTVMGLSNASHHVLAGLSESSGLGWHRAISAEDARAYKPDPALYRRAMSMAPTRPRPTYLVAAHAWDLRAAAAAGLRTAYVPRPAGDPPARDDAFDLYAEDLTELYDMVSATAT